ncbi:MAG TPA: arginine--tRNA ligase [Candidatus Bathyarchaeia archaeon]|nr:arginine--tRNA ligase [Candidatus Bathyarchaeia archaeon]
MTIAPRVTSGPFSDPFGQFRAECERVLRSAYSDLQKSDRKRFPELDLASSLEDPPNQDFGHLASSVSFELARVQKTKPMAIAKEIVEQLDKTNAYDLIESVQAAEPGYVNFNAKIETLAQLTLDAILHEGSSYGLLKTNKPQRVIVEHTSANPARPIHIGTAKNSIFGDTLARILAGRGHDVKTHFYIDDTGRQVAQMAYGYRLLGEPGPDGKPDEFFGKIYSITSTLVELDENKKRLALLKKTNASDIDIVAVTKELDEWVGVAAELRSKHPVEFDLISEKVGKDPDPQGSINELIRKYEKADPETRTLIRRVSQMVLAGFEETLRRAHIHFDQWDWESDMLWTGRVSELLDRLKETGLAHNKSGAWVLDAGKAVDDLALREKLGLSKSFEVTSLTLTRSDGTTLYPTRDIAYSLYKFEKADRVINVIGVEQSLAQLQVKVAMWILGYRKEAMNFLHFPIGLLTLEGQRMSARRGRYLTFDQLLDEALLRAREEVEKRSTELPAEVKHRVAESLSVSAVRYAMLSVEAVRSTNFTWDRALNFEANSAPFINYAYTRGLSILKKLGSIKTPSTFDRLTEPAEQNLVLALARFPETFMRSAEELNPTLLCLYANELAQRFHEFYEKSDISHLQDEELKGQRASLVEATETVLKCATGLLGLKLAERM